MRRIQFYAHGGLIRWHSGFVSFQQPWTINYQKYHTPLPGGRFSQCNYPNYTRIKPLDWILWMFNISEFHPLLYTVLHLERLLTCISARKHSWEKVILQQQLRSALKKAKPMCVCWSMELAIWDHIIDITYLQARQTVWSPWVVYCIQCNLSWTLCCR